MTEAFERRASRTLASLRARGGRLPIRIRRRRGRGAIGRSPRRLLRLFGWRRLPAPHGREPGPEEAQERVLVEVVVEEQALGPERRLEVLDALDPGGGEEIEV